jgi:hypothetical protein
MSRNPVAELLDPNYAEYQDLTDFYDAKFQAWREKNIVKRACATSALIAAAVVVGGLYFVGCWVIPFFRALVAAR